MTAVTHRLERMSAFRLTILGHVRLEWALSRPTPEDSNSLTARKRRPLYTVALWSAPASQAAGNGGIGRPALVKHNEYESPFALL